MFTETTYARQTTSKTQQNERKNTRDTTKLMKQYTIYDKTKDKIRKTRQKEIHNSQDTTKLKKRYARNDKTKDTIRKTRKKKKESISKTRQTQGMRNTRNNNQEMTKTKDGTYKTQQNARNNE